MEKEKLVIVSAERTEEEKKEAYSVEWRDPGNTPNVFDRLRLLFS